MLLPDSRSRRTHRSVEVPERAAGKDIPAVHQDRRDEWFTKFDDAGLALLYQERKADGSDSTFNKLVQRG